MNENKQKMRTGDNRMPVKSNGKKGIIFFSLLFMLLVAPKAMAATILSEEISLKYEQSQTFYISATETAYFKCSFSTQGVVYANIYDENDSYVSDVALGWLLKPGEYRLVIYCHNESGANLFINVESIPVSFETLTLPYSKYYRFDSGNSTDIGGKNAQFFTFTLDEPAALDFYNDKGAYFYLLNSEMKHVYTAGSFMQALPAGTYYLMITNNTTDLTVVKINELQYDYIDISGFPHSETYNFNDAQLTNDTGMRLLGYTITLDKTALVNISALFNRQTHVNTRLYNDKMQQIAYGYADTEISFSQKLLPSGTYYLFLSTQSYIDLTATLNINCEAIETIASFPYSKLHTLDADDTKSTYLSFELENPSEMYLYFDNEYVMLYNEAGVEISGSWGTINTTLAPGTYFIRLPHRYYKISNTLTVRKSEYQPISLPYSKEYTFDERESKGFIITLTEETMLAAWETTYSNLYFQLYDGDMKTISDWGNKKLPAGTYYLKAQNQRYSKTTTTINVAENNITYTEITSFPFKETLDFSGEHPRLNGKKVKGFKFTLSEDTQLDLYCSRGASYFTITLYDENMQTKGYNANIKYPAGTYYATVVYNGYYETTDFTINPVKLEYTKITLPYSKEHTFDENTLSIGGKKIKGFKFTLTQDTLLNLHKSNNTYGLSLNLYDENMSLVYLYAGQKVAAGTYYLNAEWSYSGTVTTTITANAFHVNYTDISAQIPYKEKLTFSGNDAVYNGQKLKGFSFTLGEEKDIVIESTTSGTRAILFNSAMANLETGTSTMIQKLPAGLYYIWLMGDSTTTFSVSPASLENYTAITLNYEQKHTFSDENTINIGGNKTKLFKFNVFDDKYFDFYSSDFGPYFRLFYTYSDGGTLYPETAGISINNYRLSPSYTYYLWVDDRYYTGSGDLTTTLNITDQLVYEEVEFPCTQAIKLDRGRKGLKFTLDKSTELVLSCDVAYSYDLYDENMNHIYFDYYDSKVEAGTYYLKLNFSSTNVPDDATDFPVANLHIEEASYPEVKFPYEVEYTLNGSSDTKRFSFTLEKSGYVTMEKDTENGYATVYYTSDANNRYWNEWYSSNATRHFDAGTYYIKVRGNESVKLSFKPYNINYQPVSIPFEETHVFDSSLPVVDSYRIKAFTFTLNEGTMLDISDSEDRLEFSLYDENMNRVYTSMPVPAGKYYLLARRYYDNSDCVTTIRITKGENWDYTAVSIPYNAVHTFNADNIIEFDGLWMKTLKFTLTGEKNLLFSSSYLETIFILFDSGMKQISISYGSLIDKLPAGTYYLWVAIDDDYSEDYGEDLTATIKINETGEIRYETISLPYEQTHTFNVANGSIVAGDNNVKFFTFEKTDDERLNISSSNFGAFFQVSKLYDGIIELYDWGLCTDIGSSGTYYISVDDRYYQGAGDFTTTISMKKPEYTVCSFPSSNTVVVNEYQKRFTFTLDRETEVNISFVSNGEDIGHNLTLYNSNMNEIYSSSANPALPAGTYHIELDMWYRTDDYTKHTDYATAELILSEVDLNYTDITLSYSQSNTFSATTDELIGGFLTKGFKFTLDTQEILNISSSDSIAYFTLYDEYMQQFNSGTLINTLLEAGTYYLRVDNRYFEEAGDYQAVLNVKKVVIEYLPVTLPYTGNYPLSNAVNIGDYRILGFSFSIDSYEKFSCRVVGISNYRLALYDTDMDQINETWGDTYDMYLEPGDYYLQLHQYYYSSENGNVLITFGTYPTITALNANIDKLTVAQNASAADIKTALAQIIITGTADNGQTTTLQIPADNWTIGDNELSATATPKQIPGFIMTNGLTVDVSIEKTAPALPVIISLKADKTSISVPETKTDESLMDILVNLVITGVANNGDNINMTNSYSGWIIAENGLSAVFTPVENTTGYTYKENLSLTVQIIRTALPEFISLTVDKSEIIVTSGATEKEIKEVLTDLVVRGTVDNGQIIVLSNTSAAWELSPDETSATYTPSASLPGYKFADNLSVTVTIKRHTSSDLSDLSNPDILIYSVNRTIFIQGIDTPDVVIYDISGRLIAKDKTNAVVVPNAGAYLVKVNNRIEKVIVR